MKWKHAVLLIEFSRVAMLIGNHSVEFHVVTLAIQNACLPKADCMVIVIDVNVFLVLFFALQYEYSEYTNN